METRRAKTRQERENDYVNAQFLFTQFKTITLNALKQVTRLQEKLHYQLFKLLFKCYTARKNEMISEAVLETIIINT